MPEQTTPEQRSRYPAIARYTGLCVFVAMAVAWYVTGKVNVDLLGGTLLLAGAGEGAAFMRDVPQRSDKPK